MITTGTRIYGFCNGYFGRDSHGDKQIVAAGSWSGDLWAVAVEAGGEFVLATGFTAVLAKEWATPE